MNSYFEIYNRLPVFAQNLLVNLYSMKLQQTRYNDEFKRYLKIFNKNVKNGDLHFSGEDVNDELFTFLTEAQKTSYWAEKFEQYEINISKKVNLKKEIKKLPILTKDEVFENKELIKNCDPQNIIEAKTGGTTGRSLHFYQTQKMENKQWAVWWRYRKMHGLTNNTWCGWFGGKPIVPAGQKEPPFWRVDYPGKQVMFSAVHLSPSTTKLYYEEIKNRSLTWLHGYPSQIALFASHIKEQNLPPIESLEIITTGAENLTGRQKSIMSEVFDVPVRQHYGLAEGVANISEWPDGKLRVDKDFCYIEFIPLSVNNSELCKIIGTNFSNLAFPLIRYDTGDIARIRRDGDECTIISIEGRTEDYITLPNGKRFGPMNLLFKGFKYIKEAQVYQPSFDQLIFRVVKSRGYDENNEEHSLLSEIRSRLTDDSLCIKIKYFRKLPRTESGKLKTVVSNI